MVEMGHAYKILVGKSEGNNRSKYQSVDGKIILEWKYCGKVWTGFIWLRIGTNFGSL
jgi:hypothetical protein